MNKSSRYEKKFILTAKSAENLKDYLERFCHLDENSLEGPGYVVHSIYFDDKYMNSFHEKLEGEFKKTKYRLRYYNTQNDLRGEIKQKKGEVSCKEISIYNNRSYEKLLKDPPRDLFWSTIQKRRLVPKVHIAYDREAYIAKTRIDTRITFDSNIRFELLDGGEVKNQMISYPERQVVCEVKYNKVDGWLSNLLVSLEQRRVSFSKYFNVLDYNYNKRKNGFI